MQFSWPLNISHFTLWDKLKIAKFFLTPGKRWTQDEKVAEFERRMAEFVGAKYAVFCSSGSTANTLLAYYLRSLYPRIEGDYSYRKPPNKIVLPSVTWQTSCSPFIREGFEPVFIDVSLNDFSMDLALLEAYLDKNAGEVACVFITSLLGFTPDAMKIAALAWKYNVRIWFDNCENSFGQIKEPVWDEEGLWDINISSLFTSTTSTYFGHQIQSVEGGFVFTNSEEEYRFFLLNRNHGMMRSLDSPTFKLDDIKEPRNSLVDARFDFNCLGNNFRNSDIHAFIGLLDFEKRAKYMERRKHLYRIFAENIGPAYYLPTNSHQANNCPFSLPIIHLGGKKRELLKMCESEGIETRPIISGNLLRQTAYRQYGNYQDFPNAEFLNENGFYVGLYSNLSERKVLNFVKKLATFEIRFNPICEHGKT